MKYYLISGEASGDLHGSNLMRELRQVDLYANFRYWGGEKMEAQGGILVKHYRDHAFMGFFEVIKNLRSIFRNIKQCSKDIIDYNPDVLILIDYPGFNLRIARKIKKTGIRVYYYISPTVWAWHKSRIKIIKKYIDRLFVILPFEKNFFKEHGYDVDFEGHPLLDEIENHKHNIISRDRFLEINRLPDMPIVALLPGSRMQEINHVLPVMLDIRKHYPGFSFVIAGAPSIDLQAYQRITGTSDVKIIYDQTYSLIQFATAALVTSGTATLETALLGTPEVVCYKTGRFTIFIARLLIHVRFISLVNLISGKEVVKELLQNELNSMRIKEELDKVLFDSDVRETMIKNYANLYLQLGGSGASRRIAEKIFSLLNQKN